MPEAKVEGLAEGKVEGMGVPSAAASVGATSGAGVSATTAAAVEVSPADPVEALRRVEVFADLPEEQLRWFAGNTIERRMAIGEVLFHKGDPADWMAIYLEGEMHAYRDEAAHDGYVYIARAGDPASEVSGRLPFSRMTEFGATGHAVTPMRILLFPVRLFPEMLQRLPVLAERLVGLMSDRVRETTRADQQRDKLTALGKLSAGLAHELNNPAAAARRAANDLLTTLEELRAADLRLCRHQLSPAARTFLADYEHEAIAHDAAASLTKTTTAAPKFNALALSDLEDELSAWLEARGVEEAWRLAPALAEAGIDRSGLERVESEVGAAALGDVIARLVAQLTVARLTGDIKTSTTRISELVGAIKEYSYMDQASVQQVELHKGLENTLLILKHKLKGKNISIERDYAADAPRLTAYGSELNQMWTNLIDNAIDAMTDGGHLRVRTKVEPTDVLVEIRDDGAGIPPAAQARIFEPFFTTKGVGEGTGLGLDTVARIVRKHRGNLRFESKPGATCFQVRLPLKQTATRDK